MIHGHLITGTGRCLTDPLSLTIVGYCCHVRNLETQSEDDDWMSGGHSDRDDGFMIVYNPH